MADFTTQVIRLNATLERLEAKIETLHAFVAEEMGKLSAAEEERKATLARMEGKIDALVATQAEKPQHDTKIKAR